MPPAESANERIDRLSGDMHTALEKINEQLIEIREALARCPPCREEVRSHHAAIYGNGSDGLLARVKVLEARAPHVIGDVVSVRTMRGLLLTAGTLVGAIAAAIGVVTSSLFKMLHG